MEVYTASNLVDRMYWLSLAHLTKPIRHELLESSQPGASLFKRLMRSPKANLWLLACSSCDEQYFLNTCDVAASLSSVVSYHPCIASLMLLGEKIAGSVEKRLKLASKAQPAFPTFWGSCVSQYDYVRKELDSFLSFTKSLRKHVLELLDGEMEELEKTSGQIVDSSSYSNGNDSFGVDWRRNLDTRHQLVRRWHREMQKLSAVFSPDSPVVLTEKVFKNNWHSSAKWMTARALVEQLLIPGCPTFLSRSGASRTLEDISCNNFHTQLALIEPESDDRIWLDFPWNVAEEEEEKTKLFILNRLWDRVAYLDGALISSREELFFGYWVIGHMSYWKAAWMGEKYFLISDPELEYFKVLTIQQAITFVSDLKSRVNPLDGSETQHYRARRLRKDDV